MSEVQQQRWLTPKEAAKYLGCGVSTLAIYRSMGTGPIYTKWNATMVRYSRENLDAFMEARKITPEPKPASVERRPVGRPRKQEMAA